jgi:hypothetical protein
MRIQDFEASKPLSVVGVALTPEEAVELCAAVQALLDGKPGRHEHVSAADYQTEITVWLE